MKNHLIFLFIVSISLVSCKKHSDSEFEINNSARQFLEFYKPHEIWLFKDTASKIDTFRVTSIDSVLYNPPIYGFLQSQFHHKDIRIQYQQLPNDEWHSEELEMQGPPKKIDATLIALVKSIDVVYDTEAFKEELYIGFKEFRYENLINSLSKPSAENLGIGNTNQIVYFNLKDTSTGFGREKKPTSVVEVYWSNKYGIIAYKYKNGDLWKRINLTN